MDIKNIFAGIAIGASITVGATSLAQQESVVIEKDYTKAPEERVITVSKTVEVTDQFSLTDIDEKIAWTDREILTLQSDIAKRQAERADLIVVRAKYLPKVESEPVQVVPDQQTATE
jgi:hypothetical protein